MDTKPKMRLTWMDVAKGMTIILMVMGHAKGIPKGWRQLIFSYHMPFFFIVNSWFVHRDYDIRATLRRSARSLLAPYTVVCMLQVICNVLTKLGTKPWRTLVWDRVRAWYMGLSFSSTIFTDYQSCRLVWFVICLFLSRNLYVAIRRALRSLPVIGSWIAVSALAAAGAYIGRNLVYLPWSAVPKNCGRTGRT